MAAEQVMRRGFKYPLTLTPAQIQTLDEQASAAVTVWNCLHAIHGFYSTNRSKPDRRYPTLKEMDTAVKQARKDVDFLTVLPAQAAQQVIKSYAQAWRNYWGGTHDRPDFHSKKRTRAAVDVPQASAMNLVRLNSKWARMNLPLAGAAKFRLHRALPGLNRNGVIKGARLVKEPGLNAAGGGWFVAFRVELPTPASTVTNPDAVLGIDRGIVHTMTDSDGNFLDQPPTLTPSEKKRLYRLERTAARQQQARLNTAKPTVGKRPFSNRHRDTYRRIGALKAKQARRRYDFAHQTTRALVNLGYGTYVIEDLTLKNMIASAKGTIESPGTNVAQKTGLNRSLHDASLGQLDTLLTYKAKQAGALVVRVRPHGTSTECHRCGSTTPGQRESQASFRCKDSTCGWVGNADYNAALNIKARGIAWLNTQRGTEQASQDVEPIGSHPNHGNRQSRAKRRQPQEAVLA
jgi:putative transposase